ncbi:MAG TPA: hypothetical protein VHX88_03420 [Solirubrobacteraceae bacterium]|jgi:hypothetical protein|nr:hypothetical protein [Solirubrobacteraceae bacterium]
MFEPTDEQPHPHGDDPLYSESLYFNFVDSESGVAGFMRMGNRVLAGHGEVTVCLYLPAGTVAFRYSRPPISEPTYALDGLSVDVAAPLQRNVVRYDGEVHELASGTALEDPRRAFAENPVRRCELELDFDDAMPLFGWKQEDADGADADGAFAPNHYEAICRVRGSVRLDGHSHPIDCSGVRDHSWGPRHWQGPEYYRWVSGLTPDGEGFIAWLMKARGELRSWGYLRDAGETHAIKGVSVRSAYGQAPQRYPESTVLELDVDDGRRLRAEGTRLALAPLRHRSKDSPAVARLSEMVVRFDGLDGEGSTYGICEFHDLIENGHFAGLDEA